MGLNRVAVGEVCRTMTQGSSCLATLGSGTESRWDSRTERDSASRSRFANTERVGCFRRNIACGSAAGRRCRRPSLHFPRFSGWWEYQNAVRLRSLADALFSSFSLGKNEIHKVSQILVGQPFLESFPH